MDTPITEVFIWIGGANDTSVCVFILLLLLSLLSSFVIVIIGGEKQKVLTF